MFYQKFRESERVLQTKNKSNCNLISQKNLTSDQASAAVGKFLGSLAKRLWKVARSWLATYFGNVYIPLGSRSTKTALGTCLPAPVSEKKVLNESSPETLSEGKRPSVKK